MVATTFDEVVGSGVLSVKSQRLLAMVNRMCRVASFDILRSVSVIEVPLDDLLEDFRLTRYLAVRGGSVSIIKGGSSNIIRQVNSADVEIVVARERRLSLSPTPNSFRSYRSQGRSPH